MTGGCTQVQAGPQPEAYRVGCAGEDAEPVGQLGRRLRPCVGCRGRGYERGICPARGFKHRPGPVAEVLHAVRGGRLRCAPGGLTPPVCLQPGGMPEGFRPGGGGAQGQLKRWGDGGGERA